MAVAAERLQLGQGGAERDGGTEEVDLVGAHAALVERPGPSPPTAGASSAVRVRRVGPGLEGVPGRSAAARSERWTRVPLLPMGPQPGAVLCALLTAWDLAEP